MLWHPDELPCSSRRTFCGPQWTSPVFTGTGHLLHLLLHWQRRNTKLLSEVRATFLWNAKPFNQENWGQTPQPRSIPDHHVSNSYFLFFQLGLWVNHRMLQTVSHINYQVRSSNKEKKKGKQPKFAVDKTFWIVEEVWALRMDDLIISNSELFNINKKILCLWSQNILRHFSTTRNRNCETIWFWCQDKRAFHDTGINAWVTM